MTLKESEEWAKRIGAVALFAVAVCAAWVQMSQTLAAPEVTTS